MSALQAGWVSLADGDLGSGGSDADNVDAGGRYIDGCGAVGIGGFGCYQCAVYGVDVYGGRGLSIGYEDVTAVDAYGKGCFGIGGNVIYATGSLTEGDVRFG